MKKYKTPDKILHSSMPNTIKDSTGAVHHHNGRMTDEKFVLLPGCSIVDIPVPIPVEPEYFIISKLSLRRILRDNGLEAMFDAALASNPQAAADWADATELKSNDPMLLNCLTPIAEAAGITEEQAMALLQQASATAI